MVLIAGLDLGSHVARNPILQIHESRWEKVGSWGKQICEHGP